LNTRYPLLKLLIYLITGYLVGYIFSIHIYIVISLSIISLLIAFFYTTSNSIKYGILAILIGVNLNSNIELYNLRSLDNNISNSFEGVYKAEIIEILNINKSYKRFIAQGVIYSSIFDEPHSCNTIITLFDKENKVLLKPGIEFISNSIFRVGSPKILYEDFNEKSYLISNKSLFFATTNSNKFAISNNKFNINTFLYNIRSYIIENVNKTIIDPNIAGIIIALTTGDKTGIEKETQEIFSLTGTAHVLAISGLHVGIFSLIVFTFIGFINNRLTKLLIFSFLIWGFVILTGGHPSAIRAAIMATFAAFLIYYGKVPNPINILLFTVLLYIILEPTIVYSISFELSVFAITGIILLYKPIYLTICKLFIYDNMFIKIVSSSFAISFAATIPTAFLTAYYFNTFSFIYPIANLIILPLMTFASFQSIFFVILSSIGAPFSNLFGNTAYFSINLGLEINKYLSYFSGSFDLDNSDLIVLSIVSSVLLLYILTSINIKRFLFRMSVSLIAVFIVLNISVKNQAKLLIIPREQNTYILVENLNNVYLVIVDRKKYDYYYFDNALANYLINSKKKITLLKTGNVSINFEDNLSMRTKITSNFISIKQTNSLSKLLKHNNICRIDKYDH